MTKTILKVPNAFTTYKAKVNYSSAFINVSNTKCSSICSLEHTRRESRTKNYGIINRLEKGPLTSLRSQVSYTNKVRLRIGNKEPKKTLAGGGGRD